MGGRRGIPMSERVRSSRPTYDPTHEPTHDECPARHCWVADALDAQGVKRPGLLVEWRQTGQGWEGRVVYVARGRPDRWVLVEEWVSAALLTPL